MLTMKAIIPPSRITSMWSRFVHHWYQKRRSEKISRIGWTPVPEYKIECRVAWSCCVHPLNITLEYVGCNFWFFLRVNGMCHSQHYSTWLNYMYFCILWGIRGSVLGWGTMLKAGRSRDRDPMRSLNYFTLPNLSNLSRPWGLLGL
jgi:hypothetical protein